MREQIILWRLDRTIRIVGCLKNIDRPKKIDLKLEYSRVSSYN